MSTTCSELAYMHGACMHICSAHACAELAHIQSMHACIHACEVLQSMRTTYLAEAHAPCCGTGKCTRAYRLRCTALPLLLPQPRCRVILSTEPYQTGPNRFILQPPPASTAPPSRSIPFLSFLPTLRPTPPDLSLLCLYHRHCQSSLT
eukprot:366492-Chlamydomonas_euryale.AAC.10